jgi:hypothetical protein
MTTMFSGPTSTALSAADVSADALPFLHAAARANTRSELPSSKFLHPLSRVPALEMTFRTFIADCSLWPSCRSSSSVGVVVAVSRASLRRR